jgi:FkbM family methyltransferase
MGLSLAFRIRNRLARFTPIPLHPRSFGQGISLLKDLTDANIQPNTIIDVGANIGQSAYQFACTWPRSEIHCFEPVEQTYHRICSNMSSFANVFCYRTAIGDEEGETTIHVHEESGMSSLSVKGEGQTQRIPITTLDHISKQINIDQIDLLKIDVEGYEANVLKGAQRLFDQNRIRSVFVEVGFSGSSSVPILL